MGDTIPVAGGQAFTIREPLGVVGLIVPWNFPLTIAAWKLGPALAAGNTVVLKPAELTPLTALRFEQLVLEAGIAPGVVNVVAGHGPVAGARLVEHPDVAKIAFTGSTAVGRSIAARAAADDQARDARAGRQVGQHHLRRRRPREGRCGGAVGGLRQRRPGLLRALAAAGRGVGRRRVPVRCCSRTSRRSRSATPLDPTSDMGPLISAKQRDRVASFVGADARPSRSADSARTGPGSGSRRRCSRRSIRSRAAVREEIFGPVVAVIPFQDEEEAVQHRQRHDLRSLRFDLDPRRRPRAARRPRVETGVLSINSNSSVRVSTPFGGFKQSGYGRELGPHATDAYTEIKTIYYATT